MKAGVYSFVSCSVAAWKFSTLALSLVNLYISVVASKPRSLKPRNPCSDSLRPYLIHPGLPVGFDILAEAMPSSGRIYRVWAFKGLSLGFEEVSHVGSRDSGLIGCRFRGQSGSSQGHQAGKRRDFFFQDVVRAWLT